MSFVQVTDPVNNTSVDSQHETAFYSVASNVAGNALALGVTWDVSSGATISSITDLAGNTWNQVDTQLDSPNTQRAAVWVAFNCAAFTNNVVTVVWSTGCGSHGLICAEFGPTFAVDVFASQLQTTNTGATDNVTSTAATTTANGEDIFGFFVHTDGVNQLWTAGTGYTLRSQRATSGFTMVETQTQSTAGSIAATATAATGTRNLAFVVALQALGNTPAVTATATADAFGPAGVRGSGIQHDSATVGTAFTSTGTQTVSHAGAVNARAACVIIDQNGTAADEVSGVTYAGVAMTRLRFDTESTEAGGEYIYWLDNIVGGTQNVAMTTTSTANKQMVIFTMTVDYGYSIAVETSNTGTSASASNPSWNLVTSVGVPTMCYEGIHSGLTSMTNTPASGWTLVSSTDLGAQGRGFARRAATGGTVASGWIAATADDFVGSSVAFKGVPGILAGSVEGYAAATAWDATVSTGGSGTNAPAGQSAVTAAGQTVSADIKVNAADADAVAAGVQPAADIKVNTADANAAATAFDPTVSTVPATSAPATDADATAAGQGPVATITVTPADADATAAGLDATVSTVSATNAPAGEADATADGQAAGVTMAFATGQSAATATGQNAQGGARPLPVEGAATGTALGAVVTLVFGTDVATTTAAAFDATVVTGVPGSANAATAFAITSAFDAMVCIGVARPFTGITTYNTAMTTRLGTGTTTYNTAMTPRPDTGTTEGPC